MDVLDTMEKANKALLECGRKAYAALMQGDRASYYKHVCTGTEILDQSIRAMDGEQEFRDTIARALQDRDRMDNADNT